MNASSPVMLMAVGNTARREGRLQDAAHAFAQAAALLRDRGKPDALAEALTKVAQVARDQRRWDDAIAAQGEAVALVRTLDEPLFLAYAVRHMADIRQEGGEIEAAGLDYAEAVQLYRAHEAESAPLAVANAVRSLAAYRESLGHTDEAIALWREARDRYAQLDKVLWLLTGKARNPGVEEADARLTALADGQPGISRTAAPAPTLQHE